MSLLCVFAILGIFWLNVSVDSSNKLSWVLLWHILLSVHTVKHMQAAEKRSRISKLRQSLPKMSQTALLAVSKAAQRGELPDIVSRDEIRLATMDLAGQATPFGPVVRTVSLETTTAPIEVEIAHPLAILYAAAKCKYFAKLILDTHSQRPSSLDRPWKMVIYNDEAKVGNKIKYENRRSLENVCFSFLDFGPAALSKEEFWLPLATMRSLVLAKVESSNSQLVAELLKLAFDPDGFNIQTAGVLVELPGGVFITIFAEFSCMLADESALHQIWQCMGAPGVKCCVECMNILGRDCNIAQVANGGDILKPYNKVRSLDECVPHTAATIQTIVDKLAAAKPVSTKADFAKLQTQYGFHFSRCGILFQPKLKSVVDVSRQNTFDWVHTILQGVFQQCLYKTLMGLQWEAGFKALLRTLSKYLSSWHWPFRLGGSKAGYGDIFTEKRIESDASGKVVKCYASEALSVHLVIAQWLRKVVLSGTKEAGKPGAIAFIQLSTLIQLLWDGPKLNVTAGMVKDATEQFLATYCQTFGDNDLIWKFHGILKSSKYIQRYGWAPNTFALERKNKSMINLCENRDNDAAVAGLLKDMVAMNLSVLDHGEWLSMHMGLIFPKKPNKKLGIWICNTFGGDNHRVSAQARFNKFECCHKHDMVAIKDGQDWMAGKVWFHGESYGELWTAILPHSRCDNHARTPTCSKWVPEAVPTVVPLEDIICVLMWTEQADCIEVLHPISLYGK